MSENLKSLEIVHNNEISISVEEGSSLGNLKRLVTPLPPSQSFLVKLEVVMSITRSQSMFALNLLICCTLHASRGLLSHASLYNLCSQIKFRRSSKSDSESYRFESTTFDFTFIFTDY